MTTVLGAAGKEMNPALLDLRIWNGFARRGPRGRREIEDSVFVDVPFVVSPGSLTLEADEMEKDRKGKEGTKRIR